MSSRQWKKLAAIYPLLRENPLSVYLLRQETALQKTLLRPIIDDSILVSGDFGVGRGHSLHLLPVSAKLRVAIDLCSHMVSLSHSQFKDISFLAADALEMPFQPKTFDLLCCIGLTEYVSDIDNLLSQFYSILKPDKYLMITSSPHNFITASRKLLGPTIFPRTSQEIEDCAKRNGFRLINKGSTLSQNQFLLIKV